MLTTVGARTGQPRTAPVLAVIDGDEIVLIASNYGRRHNPAWYYNLRAHPGAAIASRASVREVEAREVTGAEREYYLRRGVELYPGFLSYQRWAARRRIPVIKLDPV
jgi:deazaflavin-dependent oxidoreductase (nitroreductase family)